MLNKTAIIIEKELLTDGHSPLLVVTDDFKRYVAKNAKGHNPALALINEWFCHCFLTQWDIPVPDVALVHVPKVLLEHTTLSGHHRLHYYNDAVFGSKYIENAIELNEFVYSRQRANYKNISNPLDFLHIALFDTWIENDDRKPTNHNLLLEPVGGKFKIIAIDHAFVLGTLDYIHLKPEEFHPISNEHILISELGRSVKGSFTLDAAFVEKEKEYFYLCIQKCLDCFDVLLTQITDVFELNAERLDRLKAFLFNEERNAKVFNEYLYRLEQ